MPFQFNGSTISARVLTIGDDEEIGNLAALALGDGSGTILIKYYRFAEFMYGADITGDWPIPRVTSDSKFEDVSASYEAWRNLPRAFGARWREEIARADNAGKNGLASPT